MTRVIGMCGCGHPVWSGATHCATCGAPIVRDVPNEQPRPVYPRMESVVDMRALAQAFSPMHRESR